MPDNFKGSLCISLLLSCYVSFFSIQIRIYVSFQAIRRCRIISYKAIQSIPWKSMIKETKGKVESNLARRIVTTADSPCWSRFSLLHLATSNMYADTSRPQSIVVYLRQYININM